MPFVQIHTSREASGETRRRLGFALAQAYGDCMQTDHRIVNVAFTAYAPEDLVRYDAAGGGAQEMTIVTCDIRAGRPPEMQTNLGRTITAICSRELGIAEARIAVYLTEHAAVQIYRDGGTAPDWSAAEAGIHS